MPKAAIAEANRMAEINIDCFLRCLLLASTSKDPITPKANAMIIY